MKTNYVPAIVMLSAGFVNCLISFRNGLELYDFTKQLLIVLIIFWIIGCVIKLVLDKTMVIMADPEEEPTEEEQSNEEIKKTEETIENIETDKA